MNCLICHSPVHHYFTKRFDRYGLDEVIYDRCRQCGSVFARTLLELPEERWQSLCDRYHGSYRGSGLNPDDPNWRERLQRQGDVLLELAECGVIPRDKTWLDYGCGEGELAALLNKSGLKINCYDRYWRDPSYANESELLPGSYPVVLNTSLLEHLRSRSSMDAIVELVTGDGALALHTLVRGEIPRDPSWFYLLPVHTLFFTNKAMALLFRQWGFDCSLYAVDARLWLWFRQPLKQLLESLPGQGKPDWHVSKGFMAYWP